MNCPSCGVPNLSTRHYCRKCGISLGYSCPACQFFNCADDNYCGGCGVNLGTVKKNSTAMSAAASSSSSSPKSPEKVTQPEKDVLKEIFKKASPPEDQQISETGASQSDIDSIFESVHNDDQDLEKGKKPLGKKRSEH